MRRTFLPVLFVACACSEPSEPSVTDPAPDGASSWVPFMIAPWAFAPGKTNVSAEGPLAFTLPMAAGPFESLAPTLASLTSIRRVADGAVLPVAVELTDETEGPGTFVFHFLPVTPLDPDQWYELVIAQSNGLLVFDETDGTPPGDWRRSFFTGSAPHVSALEVVSKATTVVRVSFSEAIDVAGLDATSLSVDGVGTECLYSGNDCVQAHPSESHVLEDVTFALSGVPSENAGWTIVLPGSTPGGSRSVAEGQAVTKIGVVGSSGDWTLELDTPNWQACQSGAAQCWLFAL